MIYIDITDTIKLPYVTGIQRVVREIIHHSLNDDQVAYISFSKRTRKYYCVKKDNLSLLKNTQFFKQPDKSTVVYKVIKNTFPYRIKSFLIQLYSRITSGYNTFKIKFLSNNLRSNDLLKCTDKDVLLLADSSWNYQPWEAIRDIREDGARIHHIIYDVLPVRRPDLFQKITNENFSLWFYMINYYCDSFFAISHATAKSFSIASEENFGKSKKVEVMKLGGDIHLNNFVIDEKPKKQKTNTKRIKFVSVGTIEPRKNYAYILRVFDKLILDGFNNIEWHIVGKRGWHSEDLMHILNFHPFLDKHIFINHDINDLQLVEKYALSDCCISASIDEGYGLPIAEALNNNCHIIASDIDVFREFELNDDCYFALDDNGHELELRIRQFITRKKLAKNGQLKVSRPKINNKIQSWEESVESLINALR